MQHLAENLNISQSYLREIVHANFMMSPQKLIETIRMEESVKLLLTDIVKYTKFQFTWDIATFEPSERHLLIGLI